MGVVRWPFKAPQLTAKSGGRDQGRSVGDERAHCGTGSSNPLPSSRQSVSREISPSCIEKSAVAAGCAAPARRHGRRRRAALVNITLTAGNISVGPYSSTAVPTRRFATVVCTGAPSEGRVSNVTALSSDRLKQSRARSAAHASQVEDVNAPAVCLRSDRAADGRRGWLR